MEDMVMFVELVVVVFGVLQIILFFKLWKMTADVRKIKCELTNDKAINDSIVLCMKGENQAAYNKLFDAFLYEVVRASKSTWTSNPEEDYKEDLNKVLKLYKPVFERIGLGHPDYSLYDELGKVKL